MSADVDLPPLPDPVDGPHTVRVFATSQMLAYAEQAVLADREARGKPVAWRMRNTSFRRVVYEHFPSREDAERRLKQFNMSCDDGMLCDLTPLYAAPQPVKQRKPLTEEQAVKLLIDLVPQAKADGPTEVFKLIVRAVEAAHGITGDKA